MKLGAFESLGEREVVGSDPMPRGLQYFPNSAVTVLSTAASASAVAASGVTASSVAGSAAVASSGVSSGALGGGQARESGGGLRGTNKY